MRYHHRSEARFHTLWSWLDSRHSFSFGEHYDPNLLGFRHLRVINDDRIAPGGGFPFHPHSDMEILSVVTEGALQHKDSEGNGSILRPDQIQLMSAGRGIRHSEFNPSPVESTRLVQIWIVPDRRGESPNYQETTVDPARLRDRFGLLVSPDGRDGSLVARQDVRVSRGQLSSGAVVETEFAPDRHTWLQVLSGTLVVDGLSLGEGDGLAISGESGTLRLETENGADALLFDLN